MLKTSNEQYLPTLLLGRNARKNNKQQSSPSKKPAFGVLASQANGLASYDFGGDGVGDGYRGRTRSVSPERNASGKYGGLDGAGAGKMGSGGAANSYNGSGSGAKGSGGPGRDGMYMYSSMAGSGNGYSAGNSHRSAGFDDNGAFSRNSASAIDDAPPVDSLYDSAAHNQHMANFPGSPMALDTPGRARVDESSFSVRTPRSVTSAAAGMSSHYESPATKILLMDSVENLDFPFPTCVTLFGFPAERNSFVLSQFAHYGAIASYQVVGNANWINVQYESIDGARKALCRNGSVLANQYMIGVVPMRQEFTETELPVFNHLGAPTPYKSPAASAHLAKRNAAIDPFSPVKAVLRSPSRFVSGDGAKPASQTANPLSTGRKSALKRSGAHEMKERSEEERDDQRENNEDNDDEDEDDVYEPQFARRITSKLLDWIWSS